MSRTRIIVLVGGLAIIVVASVGWAVWVGHTPPSAKIIATPTAVPSVATALPTDTPEPMATTAPAQTWTTIAMFTDMTLSPTGYSAPFIVPSTPWQVAWACTNPLDVYRSISWAVYRPDGTFVAPDSFGEDCTHGPASGVQAIYSPAGTYEINAAGYGSFSLTVQVMG